MKDNQANSLDFIYLGQIYLGNYYVLRNKLKKYNVSCFSFAFPRSLICLGVTGEERERERERERAVSNQHARSIPSKMASFSALPAISAPPTSFKRAFFPTRTALHFKNRYVILPLHVNEALCNFLNQLFICVHFS